MYKKLELSSLEGKMSANGNGVKLHIKIIYDITNLALTSHWPRSVLTKCVTDIDLLFDVIDALIRNKLF